MLDDVYTETLDLNTEFPLDPRLDSPLQELLAGFKSPEFSPSPFGFDTQLDTQVESFTTASTPVSVFKVSRNRPIGPPARKKRKEAFLGEGLAGLKAALNEENELLREVIAAQENKVGKAIRTLSKAYNEQNRE